MAIAPLLYCPPIHFFSRLQGEELLVIEKHDHYNKGTYRNKMEIAGPNGRQTLSIPIEKVHGQRPTAHEVRIAYFERWNVNHWRSIQAAYGNSPFFDYYGEHLKKIYAKPPLLLFEFNLNLLTFVINALKLEIKVEFTQTYKDHYDGTKNDLRFVFGERGYKAATHNVMKYPQVFEDRNGWMNNLSIIDLIMCHGPGAKSYL